MSVGFPRGEADGQQHQGFMTERERRLAYFQKFQQEILERLGITQRAEELNDEDRLSLTSAYLDIVAS